LRAELGIGDLVRAWDALGRDADALGALVRVLRCVARAEPTTTVSPELEPSPSFRPPEPPSTPMGPTASRASRETDRRGNDRVTLEPLPTVAPPVPRLAQQQRAASLHDRGQKPSTRDTVRPRAGASDSGRDRPSDARGWRA
jgi:hypothetical protein